MNDLCTRCGRRTRYGKLLVCHECATRLVGRTTDPTPTPFVPEWRKRLPARDETGRAAA